MLTFEHSFKTLRELKHGLFYLICRRRGVYTSDFSVLVSRGDHTICDVTSYVAVALGLRLIDKVTHFVIRFNPGGDAAGELERQYSELLKGRIAQENFALTSHDLPPQTVSQPNSCAIKWK
tara:strand:+ start:4389 stop:4751 length:363 start_codon:yes stop_codon:yes gene_type:complete